MNKKILICDDDEEVIEMMEIVLTTYGYQTVTEKDSVHLLDRVREANPDLILLDLWMPVLSGDIVLRNLRQSNQSYQIPVIVISASIDGESIAIRAGANDFLGKPFEIKTLLGKIERLVN